MKYNKLLVLTQPDMRMKVVDHSIFILSPELVLARHHKDSAGEKRSLVRRLLNLVITAA